MKNWHFPFKSLFAIATLSFALSAQAKEELHIYNWSDYIAEDTIKKFESKTGIKVIYDVYDSNEVLEAKLLAGKSGYDLVFPTARPFVERHIQARLYQKLDKTKLTNIGNLDTGIMKSLSDIDPNNAYAVPYMWGTSGIGVNVKKVKAILGDDYPMDSWAMFFDPTVTAKLAKCGVSLMDDATEVFAAAHAYKGEPTNDFSKESIANAVATINGSRKHIRYFHSSQYINDLANGDLCIAHGYSGDVLQARDRAEEAKNGVEIVYLAPKEGAVVWTDVMVIPVDAPNPNAAHLFINYLLQPEVIAPISNYVAYANANSKATELLDEAVRNDKGIYPSAETRENFIVIKSPKDKESRTMNRAWTRIKTGQ